ncbi:hypothetical protein BJ4_20 [Bacillus phage BJ4]|nr:hypothetical protein BJ4_20 [Bacillus phage BJ4]
MTIGELKKLIENMNDSRDVQVYDYTNGRYVSFQITKLEEDLDIEVYTKKEEQ